MLRWCRFSRAKVYGASLWDLTYKEMTADSIDLSPDGDGSILTNDIKLAPIIYLLSEQNMFSKVIAALKLNTVTIIGRDCSQDSYALLSRIASIASGQGLIPIIVKDQQEIPGEPFLKKALMYSLLSRYVIVENSMPSGHIAELPNILSQGCVTAVLQKKGHGSTWLIEEEYEKYRTVKRFWYSSGNLDSATKSACKWCANKTEDLIRKYDALYDCLDLKYVKPFSEKRE